ncbi:MAG: hypothetical protein E6Q97_14805 [Desulfurellales bacterium]|nr:MAG: hypothetical protein E6Q97_14805 [Desulfurellales bacterium]
MVSGKSEIVDIKADLKAATDGAYLIDAGFGAVWVPKSMVERDEQDGTFAMPVWFAESKGLV